jgi:hypothetical protein
MLTAVLLAPLAVLLSQVLGRDGLAIVPVATVIGVLAAVVQFLGLDEGSSYFRAKLGTRKGQRAMVASAAHGLLAGRHCALPRPVCRSRPRLPTLREAQVARSSIRRGTTGRRTIGQTLPGPIVVGPRILAGPARSRARRPRSTPARTLVVVRSCGTTLGTTFFGVAVGQGVRYRPIRIAVP